MTAEDLYAALLSHYLSMQDEVPQKLGARETAVNQGHYDMLVHAASVVFDLAEMPARERVRSDEIERRETLAADAKEG